MKVYSFDAPETILLLSVGMLSSIKLFKPNTENVTIKSELCGDCI